MAYITLWVLVYLWFLIGSLVATFVVFFVSESYCGFFKKLAVFGCVMLLWPCLFMSSQNTPLDMIMNMMYPYERGKDRNE